MRNRAYILAVLSLVTLSGCSKKEAAAEGSASKGSSPATAAAATAANGAATAAAPGVDWQKVHRVPFQKLQTLLPATLTGMKRSELGGDTHPGDDMSTSANATYEGPHDKSVTITIEDAPTRTAELLPSKTSEVKGHPIVEESETSDAAEMRIIVGGRFLLHLQGRDVKAADLRKTIEALDLAKLESWKTEGMTK